MRPTVDLTGQRFGRLIALRRADTPYGARAAMWECECNCGTHKIVASNLLRRGSTRSCGCLGRDTQRSQFRTHGLSKTVEYTAWSLAKGRCYNQNLAWYRHYGGRGITMCDEWRTSFPAFLRDMGPRPSQEHSLGRIDNNGPYSPENCQWETRTQQNRNTRRCRPVTTTDFSTSTVAEAAERAGLSAPVIHARLDRGWDATRAVTQPPNPKTRELTAANGETRPIGEWARVLGVSYSTLIDRLRCGWTDERTLSTPVCSDRSERRKALRLEH